LFLQPIGDEPSQVVRVTVFFFISLLAPHVDGLI
jgi:hypothetical protein